MGGLAGINVDVKDLGGIFSGVGTLAKDIRAAITGKSVLDPNKQAEIEVKLIELENAGMQGQIKINEIEAVHPSIFVAGWRPYCGWVCGTSILYHFMIQPILTVVLTACGVKLILPPIDIGQLMVILLGMLGLGTLRTYEKGKDVEGNR